MIPSTPRPPFSSINDIASVCASIGPIVHNVMVVGYFDVVQVDGAKLLHLRNEEVGEALPSRTARVSRPALGLEHVPVPRLIGRDHVLRIDPRKGGIRLACDGTALGPECFSIQRRAGSDAGGSLEEATP